MHWIGTSLFVGHSIVEFFFSVQLDDTVFRLDGYSTSIADALRVSVGQREIYGRTARISQSLVDLSYPDVIYISFLVDRDSILSCACLVSVIYFFYVYLPLENPIQPLI